jgi:hypothetical protein
MSSGNGELGDAILRYFTSLAQQAYVSETALDYQQYEIKFFEAVIQILQNRINQQKEYLSSIRNREPRTDAPVEENVRPPENVRQVPSKEPEPEYEPESESEPEPESEPEQEPESEPSGEVVQEQEPLEPQEQESYEKQVPGPEPVSEQTAVQDAESLKAELSQLENDYKTANAVRSPAASMVLMSRITEIRKQLEKLPSQPSAPEQKSQVETPKRQLSFLERRHLESFQKDLRRVQEAYEKRRNEPDFTPELDSKYRERIEKLQREIAKLVG